MYTHYDPNYRLLWRREHCGAVKGSVTAGNLGGRRDEQAAQRVFRAAQIVCMLRWWIYVLTHLSKPIGSTPRSEP